MKTKIILCTTPIRPVPTTYPPVACTALMKTLMAAGYQPNFYDIDALRPQFDEVVEFFRKEQPDILGISAVVSTAYRYTKELSNAVKRVSPKTRIILGGNLAASAEILLRKCPIDLCVIGEGERVLINLVKHFEQFGDFAPRAELQKLKGISYLDPNQNMLFTGYEEALPAEELSQPDFDLLKKYSDIDRFITDPMLYPYFAQDPRSYQPHRKGQKATIIMSAKGCVARCTFCHRWDKGYRTHPVNHIVATMKELKEKYNVGFFIMGDENFGSDRKQVEEFVEAVKPLDILFEVAGVRVSTVDKNFGLIGKLKEAGCCALIFGMESGSPKILSVMEKGATLAQNISVVKQLAAEKMYTIVQLVVGMPGENDQTIQETIEFAKLATEDLDEAPFERLSVNFFQALPGTPGYEFMRSRGLIGKTLDDEEAYLLKISDVDACTWEHYQNVSEVSPERASLWVRRVAREATIHFYKRRGWKQIEKSFQNEAGRVKDYARGGYFRILKFHRGVHYWRLHDLFRPLINGLLLFKVRKQLYGWPRAILRTLKIEKEEDRSKFVIADPKSLRKVVVVPKAEDISISEANMLPLRMGR